jgi:hypothetical protein
LASADLGTGGPSSGNFGIGQVTVGSVSSTVVLNLVDWHDNGNRGGGSESLYLFGLPGEDGLIVRNGSTVIIPIDVEAYASIGGVMTHLNSLFPVDVTSIAFDEGFLELGDETSGTDEIPTMSTDFSVAPNPMRLTSSLRYGLLESGPVSIALFDVKGRRVRSLVDLPNQAVGQYEVSWDRRNDRGSAVPNGVYFAHLRTPSQTTVRRITLLP